RALLREAHERVERTLRERRAPLERIAKRLLECEVLDHDALMRLIEGEAPARHASAPLAQALPLDPEPPATASAPETVPSEPVPKSIGSEK
ncbi:MAG TPA: cell division protein FtsH, partial [Trinickia sp.]|nr:cell division protein FtsH [Trinickia sp.]